MTRTVGDVEPGPTPAEVAVAAAPAPPPAPDPRPRLRGVSHQWAAVASVPAGVGLVVAATPAARPWAAVYAVTLTALFTASAAYHRLPASPPVRVWLRRLDHAAIFVLIAGSVTPLCALVLPRSVGGPMLVAVWLAALAGAVLKLVRLHGSNRVGSWLYGVLGWAQAVTFPALVAGLGALGAGALLAAGILYSVGAVVLVRRRPDPWPSVFGYHEVWHLAVVVASAVHFAVVLDVVRSAGT